MSSVIGAIVIGFIAGAIARFLMPGRDPLGCLLTIGLGIGGAMLATYLGQWLGWYLPGEKAGFLMSVVGAMIVLGIFRVVRGGSKPIQ